MTKSQHTPHPHESTHQPPQVVQPAHTTLNSGEGLAIASMILGILSIVGFLGMVTGIPAIILGAIALKKKAGERAFSITGIITGAIATFLSLIFIALMILVFIYAAQHPSDFDNSSSQGQSSPRYHDSSSDGDI